MTHVVIHILKHVVVVIVIVVAVVGTIYETTKNKNGNLTTKTHAAELCTNSRKT